MGMSASQARFLSLTARKTNTEYEGQQINQQRTTLSNESSNYYSQLTSMAVPVPPSSADYSKVTYTFVDGTEVNTITSLVAKASTKNDGIYMLNYAQTIPADTMVVGGNNVISNKSGTKKAKVNDGTADRQSTTGTTYAMGTSILQKAMGNKTAAGTEEDATKVPTTLTDQTRAEYKARFIDAGIPAEVANKMSDKEIINKLTVEKQYVNMAQDKYGDNAWYVRYEENSNTGAYEAVLYSEKEVTKGVDYNEKTTESLGGVRKYIFGQTEETREIKNAQAKVEQDASGRYISLFIFDDDTKTTGRKYDLTTTTEADEAGYNDAMNQYYYDKAVYDQKIQEINAKIQVIQVQDKNLELKLKQLDTEQNAISTELDAVKKVITKNVESSFKTFNA